MRQKKDRGASLVAEIYGVQAAIRAVRQALDEVADPRLSDAAAYELKYLEAKHAYLFERARLGAYTGKPLLY